MYVCVSGVCACVYWYVCICWHVHVCSCLLVHACVCMCVGCVCLGGPSLLHTRPGWSGRQDQRPLRSYLSVESPSASRGLGWCRKCRPDLCGWDPRSVWGCPVIPEGAAHLCPGLLCLCPAHARSARSIHGSRGSRPQQQAKRSASRVVLHEPRLPSLLSFTSSFVHSVPVQPSAPWGSADDGHPVCRVLIPGAPGQGEEGLVWVAGA